MRRTTTYVRIELSDGTVRELEGEMADYWAQIVDTALGIYSYTISDDMGTRLSRPNGKPLRWMESRKR